MKILNFLISALIIAATSACSPSMSSGEERNEISASGQRASSTREAILGQWKAGDYDYFYDEAIVWRVKHGGAPEMLAYEVISVDERESTMLMRMTVSTGGHWREVKFSPDRMSFTSRFWIKDDDIGLPSAKATYVGPRRSP